MNFVVALLVCVGALFEKLYLRRFYPYSIFSFILANVAYVVEASWVVTASNSKCELHHLLSSLHLGLVDEVLGQSQNSC